MRHYDDMLQEAAISAAKHADLPQRLRVWKARVDAIDWFRRWTHHRSPTKVVTYDPMSPARAWESSAFSGEELLDPVFTYDLSGRYTVIARGLLEGRLKEDIAAELGVSPGRVSQLIGDMRRILRP